MSLVATTHKAASVNGDIGQGHPPPLGSELALDRLSKTYPGGSNVPAVNDVSLMIGQGQFLTLLGPSGCGKTTLLRMIGGFIAPSAGRILLKGKDITSLPPQHRPTAMVFQNYALFPHMTAAENVAFGLKIRRLGKSEIAERVQATLKTVNLDGFGDRYPSQLSGGQQQRVALARALAVKPPVLLLDEPLGALDAKLREGMQLELSALQRRLKITMIYVTHDQEEAFNMSDVVAVMNRGRILQAGTPEDIYRRPTNTFVAEFVGRSNILRGTVNGDRRSVRTSEGLLVFADIPDGLRPGDRAAVVIRPEDLAIGCEHTGANNRLDGAIEHRRLTGGKHLYYVRTDLVTIVAEVGNRVCFSVGEQVQLSWRSDQSTVLPDK